MHNYKLFKIESTLFQQKSQSRNLVGANIGYLDHYNLIYLQYRN